VREPGHADLGVTHGSRCIAVHRTEVALAVHQQVAHRERLRHAHDGVVHGRVAVGMVFADHVTDDARRLFVGLVVVVAEFLHRVQDAAVHRLETVADVGQRSTHDDAHRVVEIGLLHLVFEIDRQQFLGNFSHNFLLSQLANAVRLRPERRNPKSAHMRVQYEKTCRFLPA
jgi:hypothetical protein